MDQLRRQLHALLEADHPQSVRQLFYRITVQSLPEPVARSFGGYITVQRLLVRMCRQGIVPRDWIVTAARAGGGAFAEAARGHRAVTGRGWTARQPDGTSVGDLPLPRHTIEALRAGGVLTLGDLRAMRDRDLMALRGFGRARWRMSGSSCRCRPKAGSRAPAAG